MQESRIRSSAAEVFGWSELRTGQLDAISGVLDGRDTLVVMPTGGGKSAVYQVAGLLLEGVTVVISPLLALEADQIAGLAAHPLAPAAVAVNSLNSAQANRLAWVAVQSGEARYLFLSPEQLASAQVQGRLAELRVALVVVDEAHCVASWGADFRPAYLGIADAVESLTAPRRPDAPTPSRPPLLALTATGSPPVRSEIVARLRLRDPRVLTSGFDRPNLHLAVRRHSHDHERTDAVVAEVLALAGAGAPAPTPGTGLVYVATRAQAVQLSDALAAHGLRARPFHSGLARAERLGTQESFRAGELDVVVATSAFGMGIDRADVRFVVHAAAPESLDSFSQEIGRAGRDGLPAATTLHYRSEDLGLGTFFASGAVSGERIGAVVNAVVHGGADSVDALHRILNISPASIQRVLNLLEAAGRLRVESGRIALLTRASAELLVADAAELARQHERIEQTRVAMMRSYAETDRCRRQLLLGYFGEPRTGLCGHCDTCDDGRAAAHQREVEAIGLIAGDRIGHTIWGPGVVLDVQPHAFTAYFDREGYRTVSLETLSEGLVALL